MANVTDIYRRTDAVMQVLEDRTTVGVLYIGITPLFSTLTSEAHWQIQRTTFDASGNMITTFANDAKYNCVWNDRTGYFPAAPANLQPFPSEDTVSAIVANKEAVSAQMNVTGSVELKVGINRLVARKCITIQPLTGKIWYGYNSPTTKLNSTPLAKDDFVSLPLGEDLAVFAIADTGTVVVAISELA